eukprot:scaffold407495_cov25-Prasinocladus_malaysianus.AAC.1
MIPLPYAIRKKAGLPVIKALILVHPEGVAEKNGSDGKTPLLIALEEKVGVEAVKAMVQAHRPCAAVPDGNGRLPLHYAAYHWAGLEVVE